MHVILALSLCLIWCRNILAATTSAPEGCGLDICFAVDRCHTINETEWQQMLQHIGSFIDIVEDRIDSGHIRIGLVSFDEISTLDIRLDAHTTAASLKAAILNQTHAGHGRDISLGLYRTRVECFKLLKGDRSDVPNIAVVITDGRSDPDNVATEANFLRLKADKILSVGVDHSFAVNSDLLEIISGSREQVYIVSDFLKLTTMPYLYLHEICPPMVQYPPINGPPVLTVVLPDGSSDFHFQCEVNYPADVNSDALYEVSFQIDGNNVIIHNLTVPSKIVTMPSHHLNGNMGRFVGCMAQSRYSNMGGFPSPPYISNQYFTGLKYDKAELTISESDESADGGYPVTGTVRVYPTVPIICPEDTSPCQVVVRLQANSRIIIQEQPEQNTCTVVLTPEDWTPDESTAGRVLNIRPKALLTQSESFETFTLNLDIENSPPIWQNYQPASINIDVIGAQARGMCSASYDPNIMTFDQREHSFNNNPGIYRLVTQNDASFYVEISNKEAPNEHLICAVAIKSGTFRYPDTTGETIIFDWCNFPEDLQILRCHPEDLGRVTRSGNDYFVESSDGAVTVKVRKRSSWLDVYVDVPPQYRRKTSCLCGNFNQNPADDHLDENVLNLCRIDDIEDSFFSCMEHYDVLPEETIAEYCQCTNDPICQAGDPAPTGASQVSTIYINNDNSRRTMRSGEPTYSDDVTDRYSPPPPYTGPVQDMTRPPWGTWGITERQAEEACRISITGSSSFGICTEYMSDNTTDMHVAMCMSDIQITGDMSWPAEHVGGFQENCKSTIQRSINVTDPEHPYADPIFREAIDSLLNTTCPKNCSGNGICNRSICICNPGWIHYDCSLDANTPPMPLKYSGITICDVLTQPCKSIKITADQLVESNLMTCKVHITPVYDKPYEHIGLGKLYTTSTVGCPLPDLLSLGNTSYPASYNYTVALSNNQANYSDYLTSESPHIVWNSDWMRWQCLMEANMIPKDKSCVIENSCFAEGHMKDDCYGCNPSHSSSDWTPAEEITEDTNLSKWSAFGECTKECDYGQSQRTRECTGGCCGYGERQQSTLCNTENCPELEFEKQDGVFIEVSGMTVDELVAREGAMHSIVNEQLNEYTNLHQDEFCAVHSFSVRPNPDIGSSLVQDNDTYTASGYPQPDSEFIRMKVITNVTSSNVGRYCDITSLSSDVMTGAMLSTNVNKQTLESEYMMKALENLDLLFKQMWGQDVGVTLSNPSVPDDVVNESNTTLIIATVVPITCLLIILAVVIPVVIKKKKQKQQKNTELNAQYKAPKSRPGSAKLPRNSVASIFVDPQEENLRYNTYERR